MHLSATLESRKRWRVCGGLLLGVAGGCGMLLAQGPSMGGKPGLWETSVTTSRAGAAATLPPDAEAKIAALPPAQQAQVRAMMAGRNQQPAATTRQVCLGPQSTMEGMLAQSQQSSGMQCSVTNKVQTATGVSFDISCVGTQGGGKGHIQYNMVDSEHVTGSTHMVVTAGGPNSMTMDTKTSAKFLSADCGDVKPFAPPAPK